MKMEDHFKETLNKAIANEPPVLGAWDRFSKRVQRGRRVRRFASFAAVTAVVVAAAIVVPKIASDKTRQTPFLNSPTPMVHDPYEGWKVYRNDFGRYDLRYPPTWRVTDFEGVDVQPPGVSSSAKGDPTFFVHITVEPQRFDQEANGAPVQTRPDGRRFVRLETKESAATIVTYWIEWSADYGCFTGSPSNGYRIEHLSLRVIVRGETAALWKASNADGLLVAESIRHLAPQPPREAAHGVAAKSLPADEQLTTLMAFLDARVDGRGAEQYLSADAKRTYDAIQTAANGRQNRIDAAYARYRVISRAVVTGGERFTVQTQLRESDTPTGCLSDTEDYTVASGRNSLGRERNAVVTDIGCAQPSTCPGGLYRFRGN